VIPRRALLAASLALPAIARAADTPRVLRIGYQKGEPVLIAAREHGTLDAHLKPLGITTQWLEFEFGPPILEAMRVGSVDLGGVGDAPPVFALAGHADLVFVAAQRSGASGILLPPGSALQSLGDLKGKRLAFARGSSAHNLTVAALEKAGLGYADIEPIYLGPADAAVAFAHGRVDAWTVWDPYYAIAERQPGVRVLADGAQITPQNSFYLANRGFAERAPAAVQAALAALGETAAWTAQNRGAMAVQIAQATGIPAEAMQKTLARMALDTGPMTDAFARQEQQVADRFFRLKLVPRQIDVNAAVWHAAS
jgi:sulfonate transport system substrate-binding protein